MTAFTLKLSWPIHSDGDAPGPWRLAMDRPHLPCELVEIVTDGHGQGKQLLERLLRLVKLDRNTAGFEVDAGRQVLELLIDDSRWGLDDQLRAFDAFPAQLADDARNLAPAADLIKGLFAGREVLEVGDEGLAISESIGADAVHNTGSHDLLSSAPADAEQELDSSAVDPGAGKTVEFVNDVRQLTVPSRFCGHGCFSMLVRTYAK